MARRKGFERLFSIGEDLVDFCEQKQPFWTNQNRLKRKELSFWSAGDLAQREISEKTEFSTTIRQ